MNLLGSVFALIILLLLSFCVMWFGWGLRPVSWGWVIWGSLGSVLFSAFIQAIADRSK